MSTLPLPYLTTTPRHVITDPPESVKPTSNLPSNIPDEVDIVTPIDNGKTSSNKFPMRNILK